MTKREASGFGSLVRSDRAGGAAPLGLTANSPRSIFVQKNASAV